ncbi:MAG: stage II sporulation protein M [Myxococcota bacterium]
MHQAESQERFVERRAAQWSSFEDDLARIEAHHAVAAPDFPERYRRICQHLAIARHRAYGPEVVDRLNDLAVRGHQQLYGRQPTAPWFIEGVRRTFPAAVRAEWRLFLLSALLFYGSFFATAIAIQIEPALVYSFLDPQMVAEMEAMYDPESDRFLQERAADSDVFMFGFYVYNNTSIGFQTFASGLLAGLGTVFILLSNGLTIGAVFGHLIQIGYGDTLLPFVIGHGSFELTAIVLAGVAGLRMGAAVIAPGRRSRGAALTHAAQKVLPIVIGFGVFFLIAAFLEAFWSSRHTLPDMVRFSVGAVLWVVVGAYLLLAGRGAPRAA